MVTIPIRVGTRLSCFEELFFIILRYLLYVRGETRCFLFSSLEIEENESFFEHRPCFFFHGFDKSQKWYFSPYRISGESQWTARPQTPAFWSTPVDDFRPYSDPRSDARPHVSPTPFIRAQTPSQTPKLILET